MVFEFLLDGETDVRTGVVKYEGPKPLGDFNGDGVVNGDDLNGPSGWQERFGNDLFGSDFVVWQRNTTSGGSIAAVPEPATASLLLLVASLWGCGRRGSTKS